METDSEPARPRRQRRAVGGRQQVVHVRLSESEHARLVARAAAGGVSPPRLLVETALGAGSGVVERRAAATMFLGARRQLVGMATNLNQLAKVANSTGQVPAGLAEALAAVTAMQTAVERAAAASEVVAG